MSGKYIENENGEVQRVDLMTWAASVEGRKARWQLRTTVGDADVSTVFLGVDHNWGGGPPILWETMIFGGEHNQWMDRYTSRDAAIEGHSRVVERLTNKQDPGESQ